MRKLFHVLIGVGLGTFALGADRPQLPPVPCPQSLRTVASSSPTIEAGATTEATADATVTTAARMAGAGYYGRSYGHGYYGRSYGRGYGRW